MSKTCKEINCSGDISIALFIGMKYYATDGTDQSKSYFPEDPFDDYESCMNFCKLQNHYSVIVKHNYTPQFNPVTLRFSDDWNWIMKAYSKIIELDSKYELPLNKGFNRLISKVQSALLMGDIVNLHIQIVNFVEKYEQEKEDTQHHQNSQLPDKELGKS